MLKMQKKIYLKNHHRKLSITKTFIHFFDLIFISLKKKTMHQAMEWPLDKSTGNAKNDVPF